MNGTVYRSCEQCAVFLKSGHLRDRVLHTTHLRLAHPASPIDVPGRRAA